MFIKKIIFQGAREIYFPPWSNILKSPHLYAHLLCSKELDMDIVERMMWSFNDDDDLWSFAMLHIHWIYPSNKQKNKQTNKKDFLLSTVQNIIVMFLQHAVTAQFNF